MMSKLPAHVYPVKDRHGRTRYRYVRKGWPAPYLPGKPGEAGFHKRYAEIVEAGPRVVGAKSEQIATPRSLDDLYARWRQTTIWREKAESTKRVQSRKIERFTDRRDSKGRRYGSRPVEAITYGWLDRILGDMWETPAAANVLRSIMSSLLDHAMRLGWVKANAAKLTRPYKEGEGFHDWTDEELAQYRATHPLGTMARLTLELAFNTAARRCNVNKIERAHIQGGRIEVAHAKGNNETSVPMLSTTRAAIEALPVAPIRYLVTTQFGKPFTDAGMGNRMRKWCDEAGLPQCSMHGLRKAMSRQLAETGATDAEGQAVTGHKKAATFAKYRAKANRSGLADRALARIEGVESFQPSDPVNFPTSKNEGNTDA